MLCPMCFQTFARASRLSPRKHFLVYSLSRIIVPRNLLLPIQHPRALREFVERGLTQLRDEARVRVHPYLVHRANLH